MSRTNKEIMSSFLDSYAKNIHSCLEGLPLIVEGVIKKEEFTIRNTIVGLRTAFDLEARRRSQWKKELTKKRHDKKILKLGHRFLKK